jgi:hypothetical protein
LALSHTGARGIDYEPSTLERMIGLADLIVYGTVERVGGDTITVAVRDAIADQPFAGKKIEIAKYASNDERLRPPAYAPGQTFVWMLSWRAEPGIAGARPQWHVFGFDGEGELAADATNADTGRVFLRESLLQGLPSQEREIYGRRLRVHVYDRSLFWDAVAGYRGCFRWTPATRQGPPRPRQACAEKELDKYRAKSALHGALVARTARQVQ